jgi:D-sedoheptulose 7-phosphate isomerase
MGKDRANLVESYLKEGASLRLDSLALQETIVQAADALARTFRQGGKLLTFGNGGSAADAQHIAAELSGRMQRNREPLPALALSVNTSAVTAIANDFGFAEVFARQVRAFAKPIDTVLGISTSGRSVNVLKGLEAAREAHATTIGLCGETTTTIAELCDILLAVPGKKTSLLQEVHIAIGHLLALLVEEDLFGR